MCLFTSSPTSPVCGAKRPDIPPTASGDVASRARTNAPSPSSSSTESLGCALSDAAPTPRSLPCLLLCRSTSATETSSSPSTPLSAPSPRERLAGVASDSASSRRLLRVGRFLFERKMTGASGVAGEGSLGDAMVWAAVAGWWYNVGVVRSSRINGLGV